MIVSWWSTLWRCTAAFEQSHPTHKNARGRFVTGPRPGQKTLIRAQRKHVHTHIHWDAVELSARARRHSEPLRLGQVLQLQHCRLQSVTQRVCVHHGTCTTHHQRIDDFTTHKHTLPPQIWQAHILNQRTKFVLAVKF